MTKLFVGSLPYSTTSDQLNDLFATYGPVVSAAVISDKFTGQSKGYGFVEMENDADAKKAIDELNGKDFGGRSLAVSVARPREERPSRDFGGSRGGGDHRGGFNRDNRRGGGRY